MTVELKECQISHNSVSTDLGSAGGLYIEGSDHVEIEDSYFVENVAAVGGGMFFAVSMYILELFASITIKGKLCAT